MSAEVLNWLIALVPVLVLTAAFMWLDVFKLVTLWEMIGLMVLGGLAGLAAYPLSGIFLDTLPIGFNNYSRFVAPWIEEALKSIVIISLFRFNRIGLKLDAVIIGLATGAGFSVVENIFYLLRFQDMSPSVWLVRGLGTAIMHATTMAMLAVVAQQLSERENHRAARDYRFNPWWFVPGFLIAVAIHTIFNQFPERPMAAMLGTAILAPLTLMAIFRFGTGEARQMLEAEEAEHAALIDTLYAGRFPDDPRWARIAALAERSDPKTGAMIRDYVVLLSELILISEETLLEQSADAHRLASDRREQFDRLAALKAGIGRTTMAALTALLPFSRNDYWELWELHHHLKHGTRRNRPTNA